MRSPLSISDSVKILEHPSGGYSDFNPAVPNVYSTYYCLKILNIPHFDRKLPHRSKTIEWLKHVSHGSCESKRIHNEQLDGVYYWSKCADILDIEIDNSVREDIIEMLYETASSSAQVIFGNAPVDPDSHELSYLYKIIDICQSIGIQFDAHPSLDAWLVEQWNGNSLNNPATLPRMSKIYKLLKWTQGNRAEKLNTQSHKEEVASVIHDLFSCDGRRIDMPKLEHGWQLAAELGHDIEISEPELKNLAEIQNPDGGFGIFNEPISDNRGTFIAAGILSDVDAISVIDRKALLDFVQFNVVDDGGFSFRYRQDPSLENASAIHWLISKGNTGISASHSFDNPISNDSHLEEPSTPSELYKCLKIFENSDIKDFSWEVESVVDEFRNNLSKITAEQEKLLEEVYYISLLEQEFSSKTELRDFGDEDTIGTLLNAKNDDGSYGKKNSPRIRKTYHAIYSLKHLNHQPPNKEETVKWLRKHKEEGSGFRQRVESDFRPDVVSTYFAIKTLSLLNRKVTNAKPVINWLRSLCQINGGRINSHSYDHPKVQHTVLAADLERRLQETLNEED